MKNSFQRLSAFTLMLFVIVLLYSGCKPSVEGQTEDWKVNQEHLTSMSADLPSFATAIAAVKTKADAAWAAAEKIADEDQKAEAMKAANDLITKGFAGHLYEFQGLIDEILQYQDKLAGKTMSSSLVGKVNDAYDPADEAIDLAEAVREAGAADEASAERAVTPAYDALKSARDKWKSLKDAYDKEQKDRKKKK